MQERTALVVFVEAANMQFEPVYGLWTGIGSIKRLEASIYCVYIYGVCLFVFVNFLLREQKNGAPPRILGLGVPFLSIKILKKHCTFCHQQWT